MKKNNIITRTRTFENSDSSEEGKISGYAAVYDAEYTYTVTTEKGRTIKITESIARGAFTPELIARSDVKATINHSDNNVPLARSKYGSGTMTLSADERGLHFELEPNPEMRQEIAAVKRGDIDQCSYKYIPEHEEVSKVTEDHIRVVVRSFKSLHDICLATYPAYAETNARFVQRTSEEIDALIEVPQEDGSDERERMLLIEGSRYPDTIYNREVAHD